MQQINNMLSITMPKRTELSKRSALVSMELLFLAMTLTATAAGASALGDSSVLVVAIFEFHCELPDRYRNNATFHLVRSSAVCFLKLLPPPRSPLFPYTSVFLITDD